MITEVHLISDTHLFDQDIIINLNRLFYGLRDMHESIIESWNRRVKKDDIVLHLGDYSCGYNIPSLRTITERLNGYKILVKGNHDVMPDKEYLDIGFSKIINSLCVGEYIFTHRPLMRVSKGMTNYHGHSHKKQYGKPYINVNVDVMGYKPKRVNLWDVSRGMII